MALLHGHDISAFQSTTAPAADFDIIKATEGSGYTSSRFAAQRKSARSRAKHVGAYHFARPEQSSATSQAKRFLDVVQPTPGESVWLDLEASKLNQTQTNAWARAWGDYVRDQAPGITSGVYLGRGYASNGTGRDLSQHFAYWWFPQYPSKYLLRRVRHLAMRARGIHPRSAEAPRRVPIARATSLWPATFAPALPSGITTGWAKPHIWQYTDNFNGLDASISWLTLDQLAAGGPHPQEDDVPEYVSLGMKAPQKVAKDKTATAVFDTEYGDAGKAHADGAFPGILSGGAHKTSFSATVEVSGSGTWRFVETDPAKKYAVTKTYPMRSGSFTENGKVEPNQHLYIELHPATDGAMNVAVKCHYWRLSA